MTWQEEAKRLRFGDKRKIAHCGPDRTAYINNNQAGVSLHCFRCGEDGFEAHGRLSAADYLRMAEQEREVADAAEYPDVTSLLEAPDAAKLWVLRAGLSPESAGDLYGFGWHEKTSRVIVPVLHDSKPTGQWFGRAVDGRKPKYLFGKGANSAYWLARRRDKTLVVSEDVLSAIKIAEAGYGSIAVLGTSITRAAALAMLDHTEVVGWFDGDKAGDAAFVRLRKALAPYGIDPRKVRTEKDPKLYSRAEIRRAVDG